MGKLKNGRKRKFLRFFSCMGLGGESDCGQDERHHSTLQPQQHQRPQYGSASNVVASYVRDTDDSDEAGEFYRQRLLTMPTTGASQATLNVHGSSDSVTVDADVLDYVLRVKSVRHKDSMADITRCYPQYYGAAGPQHNNSTPSLSAAAAAATATRTSLEDGRLSISDCWRNSQLSTESGLSAASAIHDYADVRLLYDVIIPGSSGSLRSSSDIAVGQIRGGGDQQKINHRQYQAVNIT